MSEQIMLDVDHVSILYKIGDFKDIGLKEYVMRKLTHKYMSKEFWAVDDISFQLEKGDMLGIIGTNGAGKSTLLKAISSVMTMLRFVKYFRFNTGSSAFFSVKMNSGRSRRNISKNG